MCCSRPRPPGVAFFFTMSPNPADLMPIGRLTRPHGVRGELALHLTTRHAPALDDVDEVFLGAHYERRAVLDARWHKTMWLVRLERCPDRNAAEALRGQTVWVARATYPLPPGQYYPDQILACDVITDTGEALGQVTDILETGANDVYVVTGAAGEVLLPVIPQVILAVDVPAKRITVHLLEGLR